MTIQHRPTCKIFINILKMTHFFKTVRPKERAYDGSGQDQALILTSLNWIMFKGG